MAVIYLRSSDGSDVSDGLTWANAKATLAAALTAAGAGGTVYVSDAHAETQATAMTLTSPGTAASPTIVLCVDDAGDPEPPTALATTATVSTAGAANLSITFDGFAYCYGITFTSNSTSGTGGGITFGVTGAWGWILDTCELSMAQAAATILLIGGTANANDQRLDLVNTNLRFNSTGQLVRPDAYMHWHGGSVLGTNIPTTLISPTLGRREPVVIISGVDLSAVGSGKTLVAVAITAHEQFIFENCKLGSSVTISSGSISSQGGNEVLLVNCDSADTNYRYQKQTYQGTITQESTIVRTGGASDGTTPISRKMVSTANSKFYSPLESDPIIIFNPNTGSITATVEIVTDNVTLTDAEAWIEAEYLGTSGFPIATFTSDRATNILSTPANQTSSSETWTTTGLGTPVTQKLSVTFTVNEIGVLKCRVMLAKASTTLYFDPQIGLTSGREYQAGGQYINEPTAGTSGGGPLIGSRLIG